MNALPVVVRELRTEARNPWTFSLRLLSAAILLGVLGFFWATTSSFSPGTGDRLFARLHVALFFSIWVLVPMATADCISRERRDRTLGLLFLTPLTGLDIVVAKGLAHGLRAITFWLAVMPILSVPMLMGGVSWTTALMSAIINLSAICLSLGAGLLASALSRTRTQGLATATSLAVLSFVALGMLTGLRLVPITNSGTVVRWVERLWRGLWIDTQLADWPAYWRSGSGTLRTPATSMLADTGLAAGLAFVLLLMSLIASAGIVRSVWQEKPASRAWIWFQAVFCTPFILRAFFNRWIRRKLERNPIGWLEQRQWTGRTAIAAWLAVIIAFYIVTLQGSSLYRRSTTQVQSAIAVMLAISMAVSAAGSFRRERELGVMELLLVTPMGPRAIARGRLFGIWEQFFPAIALLLGVWIFIASTFGHPSDWPLIVWSAITFATVPAIGLYFSVKQRSLVAAVASTLLIGVFLPIMLPTAPAYFATMIFGFRMQAMPIAWIVAAVCEIGLAWLYWWRLGVVLTRRDFPLEVQ